MISFIPKLYKIQDMHDQLDFIMDEIGDMLDNAKYKRVNEILDGIDIEAIKFQVALGFLTICNSKKNSIKYFEFLEKCKTHSTYLALSQKSKIGCLVGLNNKIDSI